MVKYYRGKGLSPSPITEAQIREATVILRKKTFFFFLKQVVIAYASPLSMFKKKRKMKHAWTDDMKQHILKECRVIECNIKISDKPFW